MRDMGADVVDYAIAAVADFSGPADNCAGLMDNASQQTSQNAS
jgi:hypothetical protein